ncbi:hypothetical protein KBD69_03510 [Candidatus Woesebacteria bacterium]|nr:hypothetical protein [Candidatus Woesebacteria bacterium]
MKQSGLNKFLALLILLLLLPDLLRLVQQVLTKIAPKPLSTTNSNYSPTPNQTPDYSVSEPRQHESKELKITLSIPNPSMTVSSDDVRDYKDEVSSQAIVRTLGISAVDVDIVVSTATSIDNSPFSWEGTPSYLIGKIENDASTEEIFQLLTTYDLKPIYIQNIYLENFHRAAYIVFGRSCYGPCRLTRTYIIPWEKTIDNKIYHNLSIKMDLGSIVSDPLNEIDPHIPDFSSTTLSELTQGKFTTTIFPENIQQRIRFQDYIVQSIEVLP